MFPLSPYSPWATQPRHSSLFFGRDHAARHLDFAARLVAWSPSPALMSIVPRHFMGRTQSAMAIVTTGYSCRNVVALDGSRKKQASSPGYTLLALLYAGATFTAFRARQLLRLRI